MVGSGSLQLQLISAFRERPRRCSYLPDEIASLEYRILEQLGDASYEAMLARGWRRFGLDFFRPACPRCRKCRSLRVVVNRFTPSESQRRTLRNNRHLHLVIQPPTVTLEHLVLFNAYQADMHLRRGWPNYTITEADYRHTYLRNPGEFAREFLYFDQGRLVGVGLADILPTCLSSISFFHDPAFRRQGLGVYSVLRQIEVARELNLDYHYLGYWIPECQSMAYKSQYRPHEILQSYPDDNDDPIWLPGDEARQIDGRRGTKYGEP